MNYLALGDSISIDDYTGVPNGGAVSQFARLITALQVEDLTCNGCTTLDVWEALPTVTIPPDIVTLTAGGNDFLMGGAELMVPGAAGSGGWAQIVEAPLQTLEAITRRLAAYRCPVIMNTVYDPTDGDDAVAAQYGLPAAARQAFNALNAGIQEIARRNGFLCADLKALFHGHGPLSSDPWIVQMIEPNYAGATAIARLWHDLYRSRLGETQL
ncbi:MAG TPA: SGNH/GDSL hydrolase family protein [Chthonomonadaceae bacterium]|nr:SGNH/GDSL hydrolase family protein [Chthonomonadaceae bacterium]